MGEIGYELELVHTNRDAAQLVREFNRRVDVVVELHRAGINMRMIGRVRCISTCGLVRKVLLSEAVARVLKNKLREAMRQQLKLSDLPRIISPVRNLLCIAYNQLLSLDSSMWQDIETRLKSKYGERVLQGSDLDATKYAKMIRHKTQPDNDSSSSPSRPIWEQVEFLYIFERLNRYFGGIRDVGEILKTHLEFSPFDFFHFEPKVKHLGISHYAQGRSLAMDCFSKPLTAGTANRTVRKLKEARRELLQVLYSTPENLQTLLLLGRLELYPVTYFARQGDLHLAEAGLNRALEHLQLAKGYNSTDFEASSLLVRASLRTMQYCVQYRNQNLLEVFGENLRSALLRKEDCLDEFFSLILREEGSTRARQIVLEEVNRATMLATIYACDCCKRPIVLKGDTQRRHHCVVCEDFDLCESCFNQSDHSGHPVDHVFQSSGWEQSQGFTVSQSKERDVARVLSTRLLAASKGLISLDLSAAATLREEELALLDLQSLQVLNLNNCRRLKSFPFHLRLIRELDVSECSSLGPESAAILLEMPSLRKLRATGRVGQWSEKAAFLAGSMGMLESIDCSRRVLRERICWTRESLRRVLMRNSTHVGGVVASDHLLEVDFCGSELLTKVVILDSLGASVAQLRDSTETSGIFEDKPEPEPVVADQNSLLAKFLRGAHTPVFRKRPSVSAWLKVGSPVLQKVRLDQSANVSNLEIDSSTLKVVSLFGVSGLYDCPAKFNVPSLVTLAVSNAHSMSAESLSSWIRLFPPSLRHVWLCELPKLNQSHVTQLLAQCPQLVYLNLYRSFSDMLEITVGPHAALKDISLESCHSLQRVTLTDCPLLERVIARGIPRLKSVDTNACPNRVVFATQPTCGILADPLQLWPFPRDVELGETPYNVPPGPKRGIK